jgi:hypothetical protein
MAERLTSFAIITSSRPKPDEVSGPSALLVTRPGDGHRGMIV